MKGWVGLVGWPVSDGFPTLVVTHQLQVERRTGKVRQQRPTFYRCATPSTFMLSWDYMVSWQVITDQAVLGASSPGGGYDRINWTLLRITYTKHTAVVRTSWIHWKVMETFAEFTCYWVQFAFTLNWHISHNERAWNRPGPSRWRKNWAVNIAVTLCPSNYVLSIYWTTCNKRTCKSWL